HHLDELRAELDARYHNVNVGFAHNRKEAKTHGDGGSLVGASLKGKRVLIIDDVITAGTPINESTAILATQPGAKLVGICIALDRQERAAADDDVPDKRSAIQKGEQNYGVKVTSVCTLENIITYLRQQGFHIFTSHHPLSPLRPKTNPQAWDTHVSSSWVTLVMDPDTAYVDGIAPAKLMEVDQVKEVLGSGKDPYKLKRHSDHYSCTCPAWRFQTRVSGTARTCKHLKVSLGLSERGPPGGCHVDNTYYSHADPILHN
ncbi:unnamed protein product, partial [Tilletia controversa]